MTIHCPNCGQPVLPGNAFCRPCGTRVQPNACARCGTVNLVDAVYCRSGGVALQPSQLAETQYVQRPAPQPVQQPAMRQPAAASCVGKWLMPGLGGGVVAAV